MLHDSEKQTVFHPSGLRLETGQDMALKGAGEEYVCTCGILGYVDLE